PWREPLAVGNDVRRVLRSAGLAVVAENERVQLTVVTALEHGDPRPSGEGARDSGSNLAGFGAGGEEAYRFDVPEISTDLLGDDHLQLGRHGDQVHLVHLLLHGLANCQ